MISTLCGTYQGQQWVFYAFVHRGRELSSPIFASIRGPFHDRHKRHCNMDSLGSCVGLWDGDLLLLASFILLERATSHSAEYTAGNLIPSDCRCKALQATINEACTDDAWMFCIMHSCVFGTELLWLKGNFTLVSYLLFLAKKVSRWHIELLCKQPAPHLPRFVVRMSVVVKQMFCGPSLNNCLI